MNKKECLIFLNYFYYFNILSIDLECYNRIPCGKRENYGFFFIFSAKIVFDTENLKFQSINTIYFKFWAGKSTTGNVLSKCPSKRSNWNKMLMFNEFSNILNIFMAWNNVNYKSITIIKLQNLYWKFKLIK